MIPQRLNAQVELSSRALIAIQTNVSKWKSPVVGGGRKSVILELIREEFGNDSSAPVRTAC